MANKNISVREYLEANPFNGKKGEISQYARDIVKELAKIGRHTSVDYVRKIFHSKSHTEWRKVRETLDKNGNVQFQTFKLAELSSDKSHEGYKLKSYTVNPNGRDWDRYTLEDFDYEKCINKAFKKYFSKKYRTFKKSKKVVNKACFGVLSDAHIGLCPEDGLFDYEWGVNPLKSALNDFYASLVAQRDLHGRFEELHLLSLGDMLDGYNRETVRGGHELDQNMTNEEAFDAYVDSKIELIENILEADLAEVIYITNACNDNHAGSFGEIAEKCIQKVLSRVYPGRFVFNNISKFMYHFTYGEHTIILTHGKDKKHMRSGLPYALNDKAANFIGSYIDHYELKGNIKVLKGDLHRTGFAKTAKFSYYNFASLAPPSSWVSHNFGDSYSAFSVMVLPKEGDSCSIQHHYLDHRKKDI